MTILIISIIFGYLATGFVTTLLLHKFDSPYESGDEYDAVFTTFCWPIFWVVAVIMCVTWPFAKLYEKLLGL